MISGVLLLLFFFFQFRDVCYADVAIGDHYINSENRKLRIPTPTKEYHISCVQLLLCICHMHARGLFFIFLIRSRTKTFRKVDLNRRNIYIYCIYRKAKYILYIIIWYYYNLREFVWKRKSCARRMYTYLYPFCTPTSAGPDFKTINETRDIAIMSDEFIETIILYIGRFTI